MEKKEKTTGRRMQNFVMSLLLPLLRILLLPFPLTMELPPSLSYVAAAVPPAPSALSAAAVAPSAAAAPVLCAAIKTVAGDRPRASFTTALSALLPLLLLLLLLLPALGLVVQLLRQHLHMHVFECAMLVAIPQT